MPRWISYSVAFVALIALTSAGGYVLARWYSWDAVADLTSGSLEYSLYALAACCAYAMLIGIYHTILSITGLDEERTE